MNGQRHSPPEQGAAAGAGPRPYKVRLTRAAEINSEYDCFNPNTCTTFFLLYVYRVLTRFIQGQQSNDNTVLTAITVCVSQSRSSAYRQ
jgi:hypothetical protein